MRKRILIGLIATIFAQVLSGCEAIDSNNNANGGVFNPLCLQNNTENNSSANLKDTLRTEQFEEVVLVRVVDGDTLVVVSDNEEQYARLIGINTPESVAPESSGKENTPEGEAASSYVKDMLKDVDVLYLSKDVSETDKYNRLLRYVWLAIPEDENDINEIQNKMLNAILVKEGIAEVTTYKPDDKYEWALLLLAT